MIKENSSFIIAIKVVKYLGINVKKRKMKDLYEDTMKAWINEEAQTGPV